MGHHHSSHVIAHHDHMDILAQVVTGRSGGGGSHNWQRINHHPMHNDGAAAGRLGPSGSRGGGSGGGSSTGGSSRSGGMNSNRPEAELMDAIREDMEERAKARERASNSGGMRGATWLYPGSGGPGGWGVTPFRN